MLKFEELFDLNELQKLQDEFADAMGVASVITSKDGSPITNPSNFTRLCEKVIRSTQTGRESCYNSDAVLGRPNSDGPIVMECLGCGLWDAGASIIVDGVHIANWLIGQVRNETQTEEQMRKYARAINVNEEEFVKAYLEVPILSCEKFNKIAKVLYTMANLLSTTAYEKLIKQKHIEELSLIQNQLRKSEERFQMLFNEAPLGYQSLDVNGNFIEVNNKWLDILGYKYEEVIGRWFGDFLASEYIDGFRKRFPIFKEQGFIHSEFEMVRKDHSKVFIAFDGKIGKDLNENFLQTHCILQDITEKRNLEHELKENRELIQSIIDNTSDAIYVKDKDGRYLLFNKEAERVVGKNASEVLGNDDFYIFNSNEARQIMAGDQKVLESGKITTYEEIVTDASGRTSIYLSTKGPLMNAHKDKIALFGIARDITDRKNLEIALANEKYLLETTLVSVGDGVISCDIFGNVLFINRVAEQLTGWTQDEAKGRPIDKVFNIINEYTRLQSENIVKKVLDSGKINELANHTLLVSKDGIERPIEDSAAPIRQDDGRIIGVVLVFRDFTEKKQKIKEIEFLSYHDQLTGLYNRRYYENSLKQFDNKKYLPFSIIMGDVNGLKLINDSFGHFTGDEILKKAGSIITNACRPNDVIARFGGDEFIILMPNTSGEEAYGIVAKIKEDAKSQYVESFEISISLGCETRISMDKSMNEQVKETEDNMYRCKLSESSSMRSKTIDLIMNTLYQKNDREMIHSMRVSEISCLIANAMNLSADEINQLKVAGLMHDIGKIGIDESILNKPGSLTKEEWLEIVRHSEIGYRILSSVNEFSEIAEFILQHHEKWDGSGYPMCMKGQDISVQARILSIADAYDAMTSDRTYRKALSKEKALHEIKINSGTQFDPQIAEIFIGIYDT